MKIIKGDGGKGRKVEKQWNKKDIIGQLIKDIKLKRLSLPR